MDIVGLDPAGLSTFGIFFLLFLGAFGPTLPEEVVLVIAGYLVHRGLLDPVTLFPVALMGILISDNIIYFMGYRFGAQILEMRIVRKVFSLRRKRWVRRLYFRSLYRLFFL